MRETNLVEMAGHVWRFFRDRQDAEVLGESFPCLVALDVLSKTLVGASDSWLFLLSQIPSGVEGDNRSKVAAILGDTAFALAHQLAGLKGKNLVVGWLCIEETPRGEAHTFLYLVPFASNNLRQQFAERAAEFFKSSKGCLYVVTFCVFFSDDQLLALFLLSLLKSEIEKSTASKEIRERAERSVKLLLLDEEGYDAISSALEKRYGMSMENIIPKGTGEVLFELCQLSPWFREIISALQLEGLMGPDFRLKAPIDKVAKRFWEIATLWREGFLFAKCQYCGKTFVPKVKGRKAKFCSDYCRVSFHRRQKKGGV